MPNKLRATSLIVLLTLLITVAPVDRSAAKGLLTAGVERASRVRNAPAGLPAWGAPPSATFSELRVDHNVRRDGQKGMIIHTRLTVTGRLNIDCLVQAAFFDVEGKLIEAAPGSLNADAHGYASVWKTIKPNYPSTLYQDFQLFIPTSTFHALSKGGHDLKVRLYVMSENKPIGKSPDYAFTLTL